MTARQFVSGIPLCLGTNTFGWLSSDDESFAVLDRFYEAGGRMLDTAQGYSVWVEGHVGGESEAVIGRWIEARGVRAEMRIATKTGIFGKPGDLSPAKVAEELEKSLTRLRTDYVDLYFAHRDDETVPLEDVAAGFDALIEAGKVREIGASNFTAQRLGQALHAAQAGGFAPYTALQNEYNLVRREDCGPELQEMCLTHGIAALPYFGLASGFLTGKYRSTDDFSKSARGSGMDRFFEKGLPILEVMDAIAAETGASHSAIALAWLNAQPWIAAPIAGARIPEQVGPLVEGAKLTLSEEQVARLTAAGA